MKYSIVPGVQTFKCEDVGKNFRNSMYSCCANKGMSCRIRKIPNVGYSVEIYEKNESSSD